MGGLFKFLIFAIIGLGIYIYYKIANKRSKGSGKKIAQRCKEDFSYANGLAGSLNHLYFKRDFSEQKFHDRISKISENTPFYDHVILLFHKLDSSNYLIVTNCSEMDYNITAVGKMGFITKTDQFNFKLSIDITNNTLKAYSDYFNDNTDKNLRNNFLDKLFKYLTEEDTKELTWSKSFGESQSELSSLAAEAITEFKSGKTQKLNLK